MPKTVLIVGRDLQRREELSDILRGSYDILTAADGGAALSALGERAGAISAILLLLADPADDGLATLERLCGSPAFRQIPVIAAADRLCEALQIRAAALGACGCVGRPFSPALLLHTLENIIGLRDTVVPPDPFRTDALTGLPVRTAFLETADAMIHGREAGYYLLSCFDIENFKVINDQYGIEKGDEILKKIADAIEQTMLAMGGICCRFMADKFGLLYPAEYRNSQALRALHATVTSPEYIGRSIRIRVGRCMVDDLSVPVGAICDRATLAEESIRGRYDRFLAEYDDSMRDSLLHEQQIVNDMDRALAEGQFEPWFQPQFNHATGAMIGAEALARWRRDGQIVPPGDFIPVFERNGFIYEMDQQIWRKVCALLRRWLDEGREPLPVSINISRYDIFRKNFLEVLRGLVREFRIPVDLLRLEITESAFAESSKTIINIAKELIRSGFTVEIDDFGSGYSSLNTLKDVPASILKLDMKFFENTENTQRSGNIVESVVRMAKWLGMAVIAEGVEEQSQADYLRSIGCFYIQGYYYARPMSAEDYEALAARSGKEPELTRLQTLKTLDNSEFWNPKSMETLIFNSYVGGACIFEFYNEETELLRVNEQYVRELGHFAPDSALSRKSSPLRFLDGENRKKLFDSLHSAIDTHREAVCELKLTDASQTPPLTGFFRLTVRAIAAADERRLFYCGVLNMTEQREAERKEMESAQRLQVIMGNINGGVSAILIDDEGNSQLIFTNERYYALFGYTRAQAMAEKPDVMRLILPEDFDGVMEKVRKLKADGMPAIIDYRIRRRDGQLAYLRANASLMHIDGYDDDVITSVLTDITEKKELEDQLRAIVDNINGGVSATVIRNGKPEFIVVNDRFFQILGYRTRAEYEATGLDKYAWLHPEDRERVIRQFESSDGGKTQYTMEYRIIRSDGALRCIQNNISVIRLFGVEDPVQLSVANDITEQREAEQKQRETATLMKTVMNNAGNGITALVLRADGAEFLFANDKYYEILGFTKQDYERRFRMDPLTIIHPEDRERVYRVTTQANETQKSAELEYRILRGDGEIRWIRTALTVTALSSFAEPVQIGVFSDVTEEMEANDQLRFLNDSAHDLLAQPDSGKAIRDTLEKLMAYFSGDRAYVIELDYETETTSNTYECCALGIPSEIDFLQGVPFTVSTYWFDVLRKNQFLVIPHVDEMEEDKAELRELLRAQGIRSIIVASLWRDGVLVGFVGVDNPTKATNQLGQLMALGDYIAVLLTRRDLSAKISSDQEMMTALMNDTPGGFVRIKQKPDGSFTPLYSNAGFLKLVDMSHEELQALYGKDILNGVHPDDRALVRKAAERMLADGEADSTRFRIRRGDGGYRWTTLYGRAVKGQSGEVFLNVYYTDAAEQMAEEERQKQLLDNLPCGAALYAYENGTLSVIHINRRYWQLVEREPVDYSEASVFDMIHPDDVAITNQEMHSSIRQRRNFAVDLRLFCGKSGYKPFHISANVTREPGGRYLFYAAYTPISQQTMSIQELIPVALSTMLSASGDYAYIKDKEQRYICCSRSFARALRLESERDVIGKTGRDLFEKSLAARLEAADRHVLETGQSLIDIIERIPTARGTVCLARTSKFPILDTDGKVIGLYGVSRDVTEEQKTDFELHTLLNVIPSGILKYAADDGEQFSYVNRSFINSLGYSQAEFTEKFHNCFRDMIFAEDRDRAEQEALRQESNGEVGKFDFRVEAADGSLRWFHDEGVRIIDQDDKAWYYVTLVDITERKIAEENLRVSEEMNRLAIEHSGNIITRFDAESRTLTLPAAMDPIFQLPPVLHNMPEEQIALGRISPDTAAEYERMFADILGGSAAGSATYQQNSTKGWRWLEAQYTTVFSNDSRPVSAVISFSDITERLEKEVVYNKWQQSLDERLDSSYTLLRCNLSKEGALDSWEGSLLQRSPAATAASFRVRNANYAESAVHPDDRAAYCAFLNTDTLLAKYYRGDRSAALEYRELTADGGTRWLRLSADLVEYPNSRDVEAYLMYEDINAQKTSELLTLHRSETDSLTGVFNREAFVSRLEQVLRAAAPGESHALFMLDIDEFKHVNDTLGHGVGDQVLRDFTGSIGKILRRGDLLGRMGGDEFFVFLRDIPNRAAAIQKATQICGMKIRAAGAQQPVTASIGIAMIPADGTDFETLYKRVDEAMYRQKKRVPVCL